MDFQRKPKAGTEASQEKKKVPETEAAGKDELSVSLLNIRVGLIRKAWKHPSADRYSWYNSSFCFQKTAKLMLLVKFI